MNKKNTSKMLHCIEKSKWLILVSTLAIIMGFLALSFRDGSFSFDANIYKIIRLPEIIILMVGTLGAMISTLALHLITKNKIADIGTVGMTSVNHFLIVIVYGMLTTTIFIQIREFVLPLVYFAGSLFILALIFLLTYRFRESATKIVLIGIVFSLTISAVSSMILSSLGSTKQLYLRNYSIGMISIGIDILTSNSSIIIYTMLSLAILLFVVFSRQIRVVYSDPEKALSLGIKVKLIRVILFLIVGLGSAASFTALGPVSFIGFIGANLVYLFYKRVGIMQMVLSLLVALILMFGVYLLKHTLISETIPIGIVTNVIAVPYLIFVLWKGDGNE